MGWGDGVAGPAAPEGVAERERSLAEIIVAQFKSRPSDIAQFIVVAHVRVCIAGP